ncbi:MAG: hypothetical protein KJP17_05600 [Gammaproteobacteria bacterium]|nr:hypothetical protein [Gammaproteobacteria bacterium]
MRSSYLAVILLLLFCWGCSDAPTIRDVDSVSAETRLVFGTAEVIVDGKKETWGASWTGTNNFYLTLLPEQSNEAISYLLDKDGVFYWSLPPGDYLLLGYHWHEGQTQRSGDLRSRFTVPATGPDVYIGSLVFISTGWGLMSGIDDRFESVASLYDARFPHRRGTAAKDLLESPAPIGRFTAVEHECAEAWKIECTDRYRGVTPLAPGAQQSGFPTVPSLNPEFRWKACGRHDVSYDLVVYEAATFNVSGALKTYHTRGRVAAYVEDLKEPHWQPDITLKPDTRYFWSVRLRDGDTVSDWSTISHSTFLLVYSSSGEGQWFRFKTGWSGA